MTRRRTLTRRGIPTYPPVVVDGDVFGALASPVRRRLLEFLAERPRTVSDLAAEFDLGRPAISEHLQVLRAAHLVEAEQRGRQRFYHLDPRPLVDVDEWLHPFERFWRQRLRSLQTFLDEHAENEESS